MIRKGMFQFECKQMCNVKFEALLWSDRTKCCSSLHRSGGYNRGRVRYIVSLIMSCRFI